MNGNSALIFGAVGGLGTVVALMAYRLTHAEKRPILTITPAMSPTSKSYFLTATDKDDPRIVVQFLLKNTGSLPAKGIIFNCANAAITNPETIRSNETTYTPSAIDLNPNEEWVVSFDYRSGSSLEPLELPESMALDIQLSYHSGLLARYSAKCSYMISKENVQLIGSTSA